ncbi:MAG: hypothetical protein GF329_00950, partial [Candidatus Lokiarchaeota archaeon]|nr:hypothetical protein [Candidatus Lokiarchaeota archaeon]
MRIKYSIIRLKILFTIIILMGTILFIILNGGIKPQTLGSKNLLNESGLSEDSISAAYIMENETNVMISLNKTVNNVMEAQNILNLSTGGWNFTSTTLSFENIHFNETTVIEDTHSGSWKKIFDGNSLNEMWAQEYKLPSNHCQLLNISLYIGHQRNYRLWVNVFNATGGSGEADTVPDELIASSDEILVSGGPPTIEEYINFPFSESIILNTSDTVNHSFFLILAGINLESPSKGEIHWEYADDDGEDYGNALLWSGADWSLDPFDFLSNVSVKEIIFPESVNMKVNDTISSKINVSNGFVPGSGYVTFSSFVDKS